MTTREERNRRGAHGRRSAVAAISASIARPQPRPGDAPGKAAVVEPERLVSSEAGGQDLALPGAGRGFESFQLSHDLIERVGPFHPRLRGQALPDREEAQKVAGGNRLDLGT